MQSQNPYLSVLILGETRKEISRISDSNKKEKIRIWLDQELPAWFANHILPIDHQVAYKWRLLQNQTERMLPAIDSLITATALHFDLILVTRNVKNLDYPNLELVYPFYM